MGGVLGWRRVYASVSCETFRHAVGETGGSYVVGAEAIANVKDHTMTCIGSGANQKVVTWQAITDDGVAYGTAEGSDAMFVVTHGDSVKTYPIPAEAEKTRVLGFTSDPTAILFDANTGTVNGNPVL